MTPTDHTTASHALNNKGKRKKKKKKIHKPYTHGPPLEKKRKTKEKKKKQLSRAVPLRSSLAFASSGNGIRLESDALTC